MPNSTKTTHVAAGVLLRSDGQFLLGSRPEGKPYAGWWEFPGGKLEAGESAHEALVRELQEEMGILVQAATPWLVQRFVYPHATVRLNFFRVTAWDGELQAHEGQAFAWQTPGSLSVEPVLPANTAILRALQLPSELALSNVAELGTSAWLNFLDEKLAAGLRWLILREPQLDHASYGALVATVCAKVQAHGGRVILHGQHASAWQHFADGVHWRAEQLMAATQRPAIWCGASVHNVAELEHAAALGVDYVILGSVLPTASHLGAATLGWHGFASLVAHGWPMPVYALGGMQPRDVPQAQGFGGQGVAMLRAAWG